MKRAGFGGAFLGLAVGLVSALLAWPAHADERLIRERLPAMLPGLPKIEEVAPASLPGVSGLWSVRIGGHLVYTDAQATVLVEGQVIDLATKRNLSQEALNKALAVDFDTLPLRDAIVTHKNGTGERRLAVFADPTCGFCRQFEPALVKLSNATVYTFVIDMLGPQATDKAKRIVCAKDPAAAWSAWMLQSQPPADPADCEAASVLERNKALASRLGVTGTPTTLLTDRSRLGGAVALEALEAAVDKAAAAKPDQAAAAKPDQAAAAKPAATTSRQ